MAEAAAANLLSTLNSPEFMRALEKLAPRIEPDKFRGMIETVQALLPDAEKKQESSVEVKNCLEWVRNKLYAAEDLFDAVAFGSKFSFRQLFSLDLGSYCRRELMRRIDSNERELLKILVSFHGISKKMKDVGIVESRSERRPVHGIMWEGRGPGAFVVDSKDVIGRDADKEAILRMLMDVSNDDPQNFPVVAIVGIGGMGKTTLAHLIYNQEEVLGFDNRGFACLSDKYDEKEILVKIFQSMFKGDCGDISLNDLRIKIRGLVEGKKFLLVLDDVSNQSHGMWQDHLSVLSNGSKGSKIVVTSTSLPVEGAMGALQTYRLPGLSDANSWNLFKRVVGFTPEQEKDSRWTDLGKEIVDKCANVPLAIKIMASLLCEKNTIEEWESFRNEELPKLGKGYEDGIMGVLKLSYDHLPSSVKPCFAYCALFPRGHEFWKNELIYLWISQGYIMSTNEKKQTVEDVGRSYFMGLLRRSFFQDAESYYEDDMRCKMHDLVYDLAQHVAGDRRRHVSVSGFDNKCSLAAHLDKAYVRHLRSFISCGDMCNLGEKVWFRPFQVLRALSLPHLEIENVQSEIGMLFHLRYLNVSGNKFTTLPHSITALVNLCTLNISHCPKLQMLPDDISRLSNLRHLINKGCNLMHMPQGFEELTVLQRLDEFIVSRGTSGRPKSGLDVLPRLELKGHLQIHFIDQTYEWDEVKCWQPPRNLQQLRVRGYMGKRIPQLLSNDDPASILPQLTSLHLFSCSRVKCLPPLRHIPHLNHLSLVDMLQLEYIQGEDGYLGTQNPDVEADANESFLPLKLEELTLENLPELKGWWRKTEVATRGEDEEVATDKDLLPFPSLSQLHITRCPEFNSILYCPRLCFLEITGTVNMEVMQKLLSARYKGSSLESVTVIECDELEIFQGESLTSLQHLTIRRCMNLREVHLAPEDVNPRSCRVVKIVDCPEFIRGCKHGRGQDWRCALYSCGSEIEVIGKGRATIFTPPPPPLPLPPLLSFHHNFAPLTVRRIPRNDGLDSQGDIKLGDPNQETDVEKDAANNESEPLSKGMLFLSCEGVGFEKEKLIQLWMAMGSIRNEPLEINGAVSFEKLMCEEYISPLSDSSSLYRLNTEKVNSDLVKIQDKSKYLILERTSQHIAAPEDVLHVSIVYDDINDAILETLRKFKNLNALSFHGSCGSRLEQVWEVIFGFTSLAVLDLSGTDIKELPSSIRKTAHLKYIDLSWTPLEHLPEAISCLQRLQTLKLKGCSGLRRLPRDMKSLSQLRHLDFNILGQLTAMPKGLGALTKLQTLSAFLVGAQEGFNIRELRELNNLTGDFCIARLENIKSADDAEWASISTKNGLKKLDLRWSDFPLRDLKNEVVDDSVLKNLRPHSDLEELHIRCYGGPNLPTWVADESFHKLAGIILFKCVHVSMLPSLQKLPSLQYLELISLNSVVTVGVRGENGYAAFPKLQKLTLDEMLSLNSWTETEEGDFPCLAELIIKDCPNLSELPSLPYLSSMKRLAISRCPQVQLLTDRKLSTSLEFFIVEDCFRIKFSLERRKVWKMIKEVPNVWIDQEAPSEPSDLFSYESDDESDDESDQETEDGAEDAKEN